MGSLKTWRLSPTALWIAVWFLLALALRLSFLTSKPFWMDEAATTLFSLGNSSHSVPLDQMISLDQLLIPLQPRPEATVGDTIQYLMAEDNHPPAYFALAHLWMDLFPAVRGVASPWAARALPALLGALCVPAVYLAGWLGFRSVLAGQLSAAFMAVSPFGVAMAQEARHYSLTTLLVALGLACFAVGAQSLREAHGDEPPARPISLAFGLLWVGINALAFATHYFTALALLAQALVLLGLAWHQGRTKPQALWRRPWQRLYGVMLGTLAACLVWLPVLLNFYGSGQSSNVAIDLSQPMRWVDPLAQMLAGLIFMVITPITHAQGAVGIGAVVLSVVVLLPLLVGLVRRLIQAAGLVSRSAAGRFDLVVMGGFVLAAIGLFFVVTYGLAMDITRGHRYNVVFHPGVVVLVGGLLAAYWPEPDSDAAQVTARIPLTGWQMSGRRSVQMFWLAGLASAIFVVTNLAFAKYFAPAHLIETIQAESSYPAVVGFPTHIEDKPTVIGHELLSIGWEMHRHFHPDDPAGGWATPPQFFLWTLPSTPTVPPEETLATILSMPLRPFDLWFLHSSQDLSDQGCQPLGQGNRGSHGYSHYVCR